MGYSATTNEDNQAPAQTRADWSFNHDKRDENQAPAHSHVLMGHLTTRNVGNHAPVQTGVEESSNIDKRLESSTCTEKSRQYIYAVEMFECHNCDQIFDHISVANRPRYAL